jgi:hypothetical protein
LGLLALGPTSGAIVTTTHRGHKEDGGGRENVEPSAEGLQWALSLSKAVVSINPFNCRLATAETAGEPAATSEPSGLSGQPSMWGPQALQGEGLPSFLSLHQGSWIS